MRLRVELGGGRQHGGHGGVVHGGDGGLVGGGAALPGVPGLPAHGPPALPLGRLRLEGPREALLRDEGVLQRLLGSPSSAGIQVLHSNMFLSLMTKP